MKTTIDLRDEASPCEPFDLPSPGYVGDASLAEDGACVSGVRVSLREIDLLMTYPQFLAFTNALNAWRFRGCGCGKTGCGEIDLNRDHGLDHEHEVLRDLVRAIVENRLQGPLRFGTELAPIFVPEAVSEALRHHLRAWPGTTERWQTVRDKLTAAQTRVAELEQELRDARARPRRRTS